MKRPSAAMHEEDDVSEADSDRFKKAAKQLGVELPDKTLAKARKLTQWDRQLFNRELAAGTLCPEIAEKINEVGSMGYGKNFKAQESIIIASWRLMGLDNPLFTRIKSTLKGKRSEQNQVGVAWDVLAGREFNGNEARALKAWQKGVVTATNYQGHDYYAVREINDKLQARHYRRHYRGVVQTPRRHAKCLERDACRLVRGVC